MTLYYPFDLYLFSLMRMDILHVLAEQILYVFLEKCLLKSFACFFI